MCGRFALAISQEDLQRAFDLEGSTVWKFRYNIAPSQYIVVIKAWRQLDFLIWGFQPAWLQPLPGTQKASGFINARMETVAQKPAFRSAVQQRRCLVLATGYYEWRQQARIKQPYYLTRPDKQIFCFAGIWEQDGCAILTTAAATELRWLHERMPVIIPPEMYREWLDSKTSFVNLQQQILAANQIKLVFHPVSTKVNSPRVDAPVCIAPL